jgi:hypothetical protein
MRVTKFFARLGLAAVIGMATAGIALAAGHGGGGGGFGGGGVGGFHGGGGSFSGFHSGWSGGGGVRGFSGGVSSFNGGSHFMGNGSFNGMHNFSGNNFSRGSAFREGGVPHVASVPGRGFGNFTHSGSFISDFRHPISPEAWHHNANWWNNHAAWNGDRFGRFDRDHFHHGFFPLVLNSFWYPFWWGFDPVAYSDYWPYCDYYGYGGGYGPDYYADSAFASAPVDEGSEAIVEDQLAAEQETAASASDWGDRFLDSSIDAFRQGQYADALRLANHAAVEMPKNAKPHEIMSLALFALGDFRGANLESHAVLALGAPCDWPTLYSYYGNVATYAKQLDRLADYIRKNPNAADARFVLAFHDLMLGHKDAARVQFEKVIVKVPQDKLAIAQIKSLGGTVETKTPVPPQPAETPKSETAVRGSMTL